jgi:hypothetical protein
MKLTMKKTSHTSSSKKTAAKASSSKVIKPLEDPPLLDAPPDEGDLAADKFAVVGREEEAASTGHRVEPIEEDDEHNAEKLVEEGLHGYVRASPNHPHKPR